MGRPCVKDLSDPFSKRIEKVVRTAVVEARRSWTCGALERHIAAQEAVSRSLVRQAIRNQIEKGLIEYRYTFGQSYLAMSFRHPVAISDRFTIVPPDYTGTVAADRLSLVIGPGGAFGSGRHPSTRLALTALEKAWLLGTSSGDTAVRSVIDIGTGSGILAIGAARLGAARVTALDIDACARMEAMSNIALNGATAVISVSPKPLEQVQGTFDAVLANLRLPTLIQLLKWLHDHLSPGGWMALSGLRDHEWPHLRRIYQEQGLQALWYRQEGGWVGCLLARGRGKGTRGLPW